MYWRNGSIALLLLVLCTSGGFAEESESVCTSTTDGECPAAADDVPNKKKYTYETIYQAIWDADQNLNGVPGVLPDDPRDETRGYVVVNEPLNWDNDPDLKILPEVVIPESKMATYRLVRALFDNYTLDQSKPETPQTEEEKAEVKAFIDAIKDLEPMKLARDFIDGESGEDGSEPMSDDEWYDKIYTMWFEIYEFRSSTPHRSGFEHVIVGEQNRSKLGGYHFWYKYWLDDNAADDYANGKDNIDYNGPRYRSITAQGVVNANAVTLSNYWNAVDYENDRETVRLSKSIGGFDVGYSPEGLIALGMVCFYDPRPTKSAVVDNVKLQYKLFKENDNSSINTFYSMFQGFVMIPETVVVDPPPTSKPSTPPSSSSPSSSDIRIVAALVNPDGDDTGKETVSLINTSNRRIDLTGWTIAGNNGVGFTLLDDDAAALDAGEIRTFRLPARSAQLTNKTAKITLTNAKRETVQVVNYDKKDIQEGYTVVF